MGSLYSMQIWGVGEGGVGGLGKEEEGGVFEEGLIPQCTLCAVILHKLTSYGISGQLFGLISFFLGNRWF